MRTIHITCFAFLPFTVGCVTSHTRSLPERTSPHWFRDRDGYITSGVVPRDWEFDTRTAGNKIIGTATLPPGELLDPLESMPEYSLAFADANRIATEMTAKYQGQLGRIHAFWMEKKQILKEKYGIDWKSPAELNPLTSYD